jgi:hypothetical protein
VSTHGAGGGAVLAAVTPIPTSPCIGATGAVASAHIHEVKWATAQNRGVRGQILERDDCPVVKDGDVAISNSSII